MRVLRPFFVSLALISGLSCHVNAQNEDAGSSNASYYYTGLLGSSDKIEFNLQFSGYAVSGSYILQQTGDMYIFIGRMSMNKAGMGVRIFDKNNQYIASLEAEIISEESNFGKMLKGIWKRADGREKKQLIVKKVAEFAYHPAESESLSYYGD